MLWWSADGLAGAWLVQNGLSHMPAGSLAVGLSYESVWATCLLSSSWLA